MKRMLFNATQQEELRVAIVDGQRLIDIDIETAGREQRKGNIYQGVITRIEPSLEACFINYGEERHGFLPLKEISRNYFKSGTDPRYNNLREVLTEGQEILVQVEKEERGNKGAALTSYISLAGRYLVLMPNNPRGGGISRRIEGDERQELREIMAKIEVAEGMSIIARTAGIGRSIEELQWDLNYLMQLWKAISEAANANKAPLLIYLESSLVIRAIRDYFHPDISEILIDTEDVYEQALAFMNVVMPDNIEKIKRYQDDAPLFSRFQIDYQIETAYARTICLPSGGSIVIDHTEALVAIDVNSARSTRGADIEETAVRTNLEAAEEISRQLRLRDLGGLIVIDFIDMESLKAQKDIEQSIKDSLRYDRARVQMSKISRFGLMEISRQRLRPSLSEGSHVTCPRCNGTGHMRDAESCALQILRIIQEEAMKENTAVIYCQTPVEIAAFLLNDKRQEISRTETRFQISIVLIPNKHLETPHYKLDRLLHDDPRLDEIKNSYRMTEEAARELEADITYKHAYTEPVKPRKAAVSSIEPDSPAPKSTRSVKMTDSHQSTKFITKILFKIYSWIRSLFSDKPALEEQLKPEAGNSFESKRKSRSHYDQKSRSNVKVFSAKNEVTKTGEQRRNGKTAREEYSTIIKDTALTQSITKSDSRSKAIIIEDNNIKNINLDAKDSSSALNIDIADNAVITNNINNKNEENNNNQNDNTNNHINNKNRQRNHKVNNSLHDGQNHTHNLKNRRSRNKPRSNPHEKPAIHSNDSDQALHNDESRVLLKSEVSTKTSSGKALEILQVKEMNTVILPLVLPIEANNNTQPASIPASAQAIAVTTAPEVSLAKLEQAASAKGMVWVQTDQNKVQSHSRQSETLFKQPIVRKHKPSRQEDLLGPIVLVETAHHSNKKSP